MLLESGNAMADGVVVKGNVFGGGNQADVQTNTEVNISATNCQVEGNVYGGGNLGSVGKVSVSEDMRTFTWTDSDGNPNTTENANNKNTGVCKVTITDGTIKGNVFGAGKGKGDTFWCEKAISYSTDVNVSGGTLNRNVYGGGEVASIGKYALDNNKMPSILQGGGYCYVTVQGHATVGADVFGAGEGVKSHFDKDNSDLTKRSRRMTLKDDWQSLVGDARFDWDYLQNESDYSTYLETLALATHPEVTVDGNASIGGSVFGGGELGLTKGSVIVNIQGGTITKDVYGGGSLANTNTTSSVDSDGDGSADQIVHPTTTVNLLGGLINGDAYGGGLGQIGVNASDAVYYTEEEAATYNTEHGLSQGDEGYVTTETVKTPAVAGVGAIPATVYGDITVNLGSESGTTATAFHITNYGAPHADVVKSGRVFGCNNLYGSPQGNVTVTVWKTVDGKLNGSENTRTAVDPNNPGRPRKDVTSRYEVAALYGGGNLADYTTTGKKAKVVIEKCDVSIREVYGGGNAAAVPETEVQVKGAYEIETVFGGGNGKDPYTLDDESSWINNSGANVNGDTNTMLTGGTIHEAYGGSNKRGKISGKVRINTGSGGDCKLDCQKVVAAGKDADLDTDAILVMGCVEGEKIDQVIGGANNANVNGNIWLTITSGEFGKVFGGNNDGGIIKGSIRLNIEETGCTPIKIDELYLGGNEATYSIYGYYKDSDGKWQPRTSNEDSHDPVPVHDEDPAYNNTDNKFTPYAEPVLNIISCTSIGKVFGGGKGAGAAMYANPTVNINMRPGKHASGEGNLGEIHEVFGGGNEAVVYGNTTVNIGTSTTVEGLDLDSGGNPQYESDGITPRMKSKTVIGANIKGNVYGGGNLADVTGNTFVNICAKKSESSENYEAVAEGTLGVTIGGTVYGGGKGLEDTFTCEKAMIGENGLGADNPSYPNGNTSVRIGHGTVNGSVFGGGQVGRVEMNTLVEIGYGDGGAGTKTPVIDGNVFGAGAGVKTHGYSALVRGNTHVTIAGDTWVKKSVYGGGEIASVARYKVAQSDAEGAPYGVEKGEPYLLENPNSGYCYVTVNGHAEIGPDGMKMYHKDNGTIPDDDKPDDWGHVFAAGKGVLPDTYDFTKFSAATRENYPKRMVLYDSDKYKAEAENVTWEYVDPTDPNNKNIWEYFDTEAKYFTFIQTLGLATQTEATIAGNALVKGSVYGGSENGLVQFNTNVVINGNCQIGVAEGEGKPDCAHWEFKAPYEPYDPYAKYLNDGEGGDGLYYYDEDHSKSAAGGAKIATDGHTYYGNVFGGGSGSVPYFNTLEGKSEYISSAGTVKGNTYVTISGGHILSNVYGGCEATNVLGTANVTMTAGTVGVERTDEQIIALPLTGYIFGGGKGDQRIFFNKETNVNHSIVKVEGGTIYGSVYGGGEDGHVLGNVTMTIGKTGNTGPTIGTRGTSYYDGHVFGGGRGFGGEALTAGNVGGAVTLDVLGGSILGNVYGGGRLASVGYGLYLTSDEGYGKMREDNEYDGSYTNPSTEDASVFYNKGRGKIFVTVSGGTIGNDVENAEYGGHVFGGSMGRLTKLDGTPFSKANHWQLLATAKQTTVNVTNGVIKRSVFGGGEMGTITENTNVTVSGGTIGTLNKGGAEFGNVYGGGKGYVDPAGSNYVTAGIIKGNTTVAVSGTPNILHNVYGGGAYGSVGTFDLSTAENLSTYHVPYAGMPVNWTSGTGIANVTITGGTIGTDGNENGMVFGSSRGDVGVPGEIHDKLAWVYDAKVVIGSSGSNDGPQINGSVYGSGENGHTFNDATVNIHAGTIGIVSGSTITTNDNGTPDDTSDDTTYSGAEYPYRGNVYGGGCGTDKYDSDSDDSEDSYNALAGVVYGDTQVIIDGGQVVHNVYGAGAMGSVGTDTSGGKTTVSISGGRIGYDGSSNGNVYGAARGDLTATGNLAQVRETAVNISYTTTPAADNEEKTAQLIAGSVFGGGEAGTVKESVAVNMTGGLILNDVYGGGALADTQTSNWDASKNEGVGGWAEDKTSASNTTTVNLLGGTIGGDAYGGGLGQKKDFYDAKGAIATSDIEATVYGDITVNLGKANNDGTPDLTSPATAFNISYENTDEKDKNNNYIQVVKSGRVFGCNNLNGSPQGNVTVNVYKTKEGNFERTTNEAKANNKVIMKNNPENYESVEGYVIPTYEVAAVYGGGNLAHFTATGKKASVIIHSCDVSVQYVYGGGNAAAVPETDVLVKGAWEIDHVFGGGNGKDKYKKGNEWITNAGANVNGNTNTLLIGGYIHEAYGGSNEKGTITGNATINTEADNTCPCALDLEKLYGAGKNADIDGDLIVVLGCAPETKTEEIYGGAENANVKGNVELTITSGTFGKVFGGNNQSGAIFGHIILNIEETGCRPIVIDELYGCGNNAAYSVYGYKNGTDAEGNPIYVPRTSSSDGDAVVFKKNATQEAHTTPTYADPEVNIISCTSIGKVYGGGLGPGAIVYGNPTVNINMIPGAFAASTNALGEIGDVFGGGNEANVVGNTNVNIGTKATVSVKGFVEKDPVGNSVDGLYIRSGEGTVVSPYKYTAATGTAVAGTTYYEEKDIEKDVKGANILGNVYGGGNEAEVMVNTNVTDYATGNTNVNIGK